MLGPPNYYSYKAIKRKKERKKIIIENLGLGVKYTPNGRFIGMSQTVYLINYDNERKEINNYDFKIESNLINYDTILIRNFDSIHIKGLKQKKTYYRNQSINVQAKDTLKLIIDYFNKKKITKKNEDYFKSKWTNDTIESIIFINNEIYNFKMVSSNEK
ncbi:hypothetical protein [Polaribacter cellanae]|uniref:Uncharacterized protein n=1 Tax=Polaribacter cellanae TaxID=2818493 RepID=A0A975CR57_9FLAO|nr:hypothetical protein [Polaribacter cellanae]QTE23349.1 hypothetical protein J3359_03455 [Polaribacter cellanae]